MDGSGRDGGSAKRRRQSSRYAPCFLDFESIYTTFLLPPARSLALGRATRFEDATRARRIAAPASAPRRTLPSTPASPRAGKNARPTLAGPHVGRAPPAALGMQRTHADGGPHTASLSVQRMSHPLCPTPAHTRCCPHARTPARPRRALRPARTPTSSRTPRRPMSSTTRRRHKHRPRRHHIMFSRSPPAPPSPSRRPPSLLSLFLSPRLRARPRD